MSDFGSEADAAVEPPQAAPADEPGASSPAPAPSHGRRWLTWALVILVALQLPFVINWLLQAGFFKPAASRLTIETDPPGIEIYIDGTRIGTSPVQRAVDPGPRTIELRRDGLTRTFPITVNSGEIVRHRFEFAPRTAPSVAPPPATIGGLLQVSTDPPRATVAVDGSPRGISPLSVAGLPPGPHVVTVRASGGTVERKVDVPAGATASVHLVLPAPAPVSALGWLQAAAPAPLTILEGGRLLGTTAVPRLALSPGEHVLDFTSDDLGFRTQQRVRVEAGETTSVRVDLPLGPISVNAQPWAEVWIDGERVGETPIGNIMRPLGRHDVTLRHPEFGERTMSVVIRSNQPARVSADMRPTP